MAFEYAYNGDGERVWEKSHDLNGTNQGYETVYIGNWYEKSQGSFGMAVQSIENCTGSNCLYLPLIFKPMPPVETLYIYAGSERIAMMRGGVLNYLLSDHLGSVFATVDRSGNLTSSSSYHSWGTAHQNSSSSPTDYGYTGQMQVGDFYYYNARWYDPMIGRFMQADTIVPPHQGTQGFDRYAYVNNNPLRYTDPSGHWFRNTNLLMHDGGGGIGSRQVYQSSDPSNNSEEILNIVVCGLGGGLCATSGEPLFRYNDYPGGIHKTYDVDNYQGYKKDALSDELVTYIMSKANARFRIIGHSAGADAVILTAYKLKELGFEDKLALVVLLDPTLSALPYNEPVGSLSDELYGILDANIKVAVGISHGYTVYEVAMAPFFNNETITSYSNYFYQYYAHDNHTTIATNILINFDILLSE